MLNMIYEITTRWDEALWEKAEHVYNEAFPEHGRKNRALIRSMFERGICMMHTWSLDGDVVAMALTALNTKARILIIDYIAVLQEQRGHGVGLACMRDIRNWAENEAGCLGIVIEVEAETSKENTDRIRFWEKAGFHLTDYVHTYIWVPETYRAMYMSFGAFEQQDGRQLFDYITEYHEKAYRVKG
ncbi:GNAT family N-acetyltransferase [Paenibacillus sp. LMG 31461]|uniref:GNAT family N-acetyltransferase n=2 Tax=Paenibacillus plantarum TaxID=2654975 RepID=A0ABX1X8Z1_9BACL|nr:GNAT family N-acetyltransferase [Paenibacillus plantarum]